MLANRDSGELGNLRNQIIHMLFKQLTSSSETAVKLAEEGLTDMIAHSKMPKHLLYNGLRPILMNLANYNKLKLPLLQGLARLLHLLSSWFNVTLGKSARLLPVHIAFCTKSESTCLEQGRSSSTTLKSGWSRRSYCKYPAPGRRGRMLTLRPLSCTSSTCCPTRLSNSWRPMRCDTVNELLMNCFISLFTSDFFKTTISPYFGRVQERPGLVVLTIELEKALDKMAGNMQPTKLWSPYRGPLTLFLNKYATEVRHMLGSMGSLLFK